MGVEKGLNEFGCQNMAESQKNQAAAITLVQGRRSQLMGPRSRTVRPQLSFWEMEFGSESLYIPQELLCSETLTRCGKGMKEWQPYRYTYRKAGDRWGPCCDEAEPVFNL